MFIADKRGFSQIIRDIADTVPLKLDDNLILNKYVKEVHYNESGEYPVKIVSKDTQNGKNVIVRAKWAIMTFSIGVLESDFVTFNPVLPSWKSEVIYMFKMTRYIKIFVKFPSNITAFWDDNHYIMYVDPTSRGKFQSWQNLEARGKYYPRGTNILLCTVVGAFYDLVSRLSKEKVTEELFKVQMLMFSDHNVSSTFLSRFFRTCMVTKQFILKIFSFLTGTTILSSLVHTQTGPLEWTPPSIRISLLLWVTCTWLAKLAVKTTMDIFMELWRGLIFF